MSKSGRDCKCLVLQSAPAASLLALVVILVISTMVGAKALSSPASDKDELISSAEARESGMAEARRDVSNGVMIVKTAGLPSPNRQDYAQLLKARCNALLQPIAGCLVSSGLMAYMSGYNEVSIATIKQRFGTNIFEKLEQDAKARFQQRLKNSAFSDLSATQIYPVKPGDTLTKIARHHGIRVSDLLKANPGVELTRLPVNYKLVIPAKRKP